MSSNGPFGFDPDDFDRVAREAGEGLRDALDGVSRFFTTSGERAGWANLFNEFARQTRTRTEPETTGETGDGVWAIFTVDGDAGELRAEVATPLALVVSELLQNAVEHAFPEGHPERLNHAAI